MIAKFLPYLRAHRWQVAWALAQVFLIAGVELLKPWPLQIVIDYVLGGKTPPSAGPLGQMLALPAGLLAIIQEKLSGSPSTSDEPLPSN